MSASTVGRSVPPDVDHRVLDVETGQGPARCFVVDEATPRRGTLVLGHGAGAGVNTADLVGLTALRADGWRVVLVDQPWVLAGRRLATRPPTLDAAWIDVVHHLRDAGELSGTLVLGGRSAGARVACRTAVTLDADLVLALAFPLAPPAKRGDPSAWRTAEAQAVPDAGRPLVVVQGMKDAFGSPELVAVTIPGARVAAVRGGHGFSPRPDDVVAAVRAELG